jgi:deoxyribodipyrimidine photo-lyase
MSTASSLVFEPSRAAGLARLERFVQQRRAGSAYERDRNFDQSLATSNGSIALHQNVSCLSPYLRYRLVGETEVLRAVLEREDPHAAEKFIQEVCWRTYWKGWLERNPVVWQRYCHERDQLEALNSSLLKAIRRAKQATTGIACFDAWVQQLVETGYLHNHTRMWFASIWIFTLNLPWQAGADFFMQHLCDADAASNTLSWRWVAGLQTKGKHYLARAENIARYTGGRFNPSGELNESAPALIEADIDIQALSREHLSQPAAWNRAAIDCLISKDLPPETMLLIHEDDCSVETLSQVRSVAGLIVIGNEPNRATESISPVSQLFLDGALSDARARAMAHWKLSASQVLDCPSPRALTQLIKGPSPHGKEGLQSSARVVSAIVTAWLPVGPVRDALLPQLSSLQDQGVQIKYLARRWDAAAWPHANKGFFHLKTKIPELLRTAL